MPYLGREVCTQQCICPSQDEAVDDVAQLLTALDAQLSFIGGGSRLSALQDGRLKMPPELGGCAQDSRIAEIHHSIELQHSWPHIGRPMILPSMTLIM